MKQQPLLEIVAGPNGSGKTTFADSFLVRIKGRENYLNPDLIAAAVSPGSNGAGLFTAGRILLAQIDENLKSKTNFAFESTLSGKTYLKVCEQALQMGFQLRIYFFFLSDRRLNLQRVKERVKMGGHNVPKKDIIRRFRRSFENFWSLYRPLAHEWILVDNTGTKPNFLLEKKEFDKLNQEEQFLIGQNFIKGKVRYEKKEGQKSRRNSK